MSFGAMNRHFALSALVFFLTFATGSLSAATTTVFYTYADGGRGGLAAITVDVATGQLGESQVLAEARGFTVPHKIALSTDGRYLAGVSEEESRANYIAYDREEGRVLGTLRLRNEPDAIAWAGDAFV
ncbi:MAG: hypothetical protein EA353_01200, partial [Puniceicoccaceae bacterium]